MEVINAVKHYQRNIEKCSGDVERMLHCLQKLYRLPVTVQHLQETGVGRTVNALRKYEGDTGEAAKALVNKWKAMVAEAESSDEEVPEEKPSVRTESPPPRSSSYKHKSSRSGSHSEESQSDRSKSKERNHSSSNHREKRRDEKSSSKSRHSDHGHKRRHEEETRRDEEKRSRNTVVEVADREDEEEEEEDEEPVCDNGHESHEELENDESDQVSEEDSGKENEKEEEENESSDREEMDADEAEEEEDDSDSSDVECVSETQVKQKSGSSNHKGGSHVSQSDHRKSSHSSHSARNHRNEHQKSDKSREKSNYSDDHRHNKKSERKSDSKNESRSNNAHSNRESKSENKEKDRSREKDRNKEKEKERAKSEVKKQEDTRKDSKDQKREEKSKSHIPKQDSKSSPSSSKTSSSKPENKVKSSSSKKVKAPVEETEDGIDSFSGTSFADALGMMGMADNVSKKKKKVSGTSSSRKTEGSSTSQAGSSGSGSSSHKSKEVTPRKFSSQSKISSPEDINLLDPSLKLEPLDQLEMEVDVDATLPAINPNYRPLPHLNFDMPSRVRAKSLTEEEALSQVMSTKNQRTKVYSGVKNAKNWAQVPSLFDVCVRVLQENIDALEYTGGVPYDLLKPVLILATPEQLFSLEHYNPYLVEDTDELWESHVRRKFRSERRLDMETHREMYQRCVEESEAKLKALTKNIQNSMAKSLPVRQTKLAYVDSIAKPPRQVARKQAKFGTANATATTPMAKVQKLASPSSSSKGSNSPVIHVPTPRPTHSAKAKPRMAPLMQKTMKLAKSFKR